MPARNPSMSGGLPGLRDDGEDGPPFQLYEMPAKAMAARRSLKPTR